MDEHGYPCGCFLKVYVCPGHLERAEKEIAHDIACLTGQLQLPILDTMVSVSASVEGEGAESSG